MSVSAKTENDITTVTATIDSEIEGNLSITFHYKEYTAEITNGEVNVDLNDNISKGGSLLVYFAGNENYESRSISRLMPTMSVSAIAENGKTTIEVNTVSDGDSSGNLQIIYEGTPYIAKITNHIATLTIDGIIPGSHTVKVVTGESNKHIYLSRTLIETITI